MKKILILFVVSILIMSGLGVVAIPYEKESLNKQDFKIEMLVKGTLLGYIVTFTNVENESVTGDYKINITIDTWFIKSGKFIGFEYENLTLEPNMDPFKDYITPVQGFGPATITIRGYFIHENDEKYPFEAVTKGFVLLFYVLMKPTMINILSK